MQQYKVVNNLAKLRVFSLLSFQDPKCRRVKKSCSSSSENFLFDFKICRIWSSLTIFFLSTDKPGSWVYFPHHDNFLEGVDTTNRFINKALSLLHLFLRGCSKNSTTDNETWKSWKVNRKRNYKLAKCCKTLPSY
jgi:hypothetical protein